MPSAAKIVADLVVAALTIRSPGAAVVSARAGKPAIRPRLPIAPKGAVAPLDPALTIRGKDWHGYTRRHPGRLARLSAFLLWPSP